MALFTRTIKGFRIDHTGGYAVYYKKGGRYYMRIFEQNAKGHYRKHRPCEVGECLYELLEPFGTEYRL